MTRDWTIHVGGTRHRVALDIGRRPRTFWVDGVERSLGGFFSLGPRTGRFELGGHEASMTRRLVAPAMKANLKRTFMKGGLRRLPLEILLLVVNAADGVGGAKADWAGSPWIVQWAIYEVRVGGESLGSWVSVMSRDSSSWVFVEPGGALPERNWIDWPVRPEADPHA